MYSLLEEVRGSSNDVCVKIKSSRRPTATSCRRRRRRRCYDEMRPLAQSQEHTLAVRMFWSSIFFSLYFRAFIIDFIDSTFNTFIYSWRHKKCKYIHWKTTNFCWTILFILFLLLYSTSLKHEVIKKCHIFLMAAFRFLVDVNGLCPDFSWSISSN